MRIRSCEMSMSCVQVCLYMLRRHVFCMDMCDRDEELLQLGENSNLYQHTQQRCQFDMWREFVLSMCMLYVHVLFMCLSICTAPLLVVRWYVLWYVCVVWLMIGYWLCCCGYDVLAVCLSICSGWFTWSIWRNVSSINSSRCRYVHAKHRMEMVMVMVMVMVMGSQLITTCPCEVHPFHAVMMSMLMGTVVWLRVYDMNAIIHILCNSICIICCN